MPVIVNRSQQTTVGVTHPRPVYSRVISCADTIAAGGTTGYSYTPVVGNVVRLLGVKIWFTPHDFSSTLTAAFRIYTGQGRPQSFAEIDRWEKVLPIFQRGDTAYPWYRVDDFDPFVWSMNQLFIGENRRFGFRVAISVLPRALITMVSFQISEG